MSDPFKGALRKASECSDTPETGDIIDEFRETADMSNLEKSVADLERERNEAVAALGEAHKQLASAKSTRNSIIAKGVEMERQLAEAREENARLRATLQRIADCTDFAEVAELVGKSHDPHA